MRKVFFSVMPVMLWLLPMFARTSLISSTLFLFGNMPLAAVRANSPEQDKINQIHARILEARRLLAAQPALKTDLVTVAAEDPRTSQIHLLTLPKETFLRDGAEAVVDSSLGATLRLSVVRPNYVNTAVRVTNLSGRDFTPLMVKYPIEHNGTATETAYYTSAHPALESAELTSAGDAYVDRMLDLAAKQLAGQGDAIDPSIIEVARHLCVVEHTDHKRFSLENQDALFDEIDTLYALNEGGAYGYSVSSAGAGGMIQMIPSTYKMVRAAHGEADLNADFVAGMRDHLNALEAMLLYMQDTWKGLTKDEAVTQALATREATQAELLAAGYNSNPARLPLYLTRGGADWRALLPHETQIYLQIYASVDQHESAMAHSAAGFLQSESDTAPFAS